MVSASPQIRSGCRINPFEQSLRATWLSLAAALFIGGLQSVTANEESKVPAGLQGGAGDSLPFVEVTSVAYGNRNYKVRWEGGALSKSLGSDEARIHRYEAIGLPDQGRNLVAEFAAPDGAPHYAVRLRYKLEGYDPEWRDLEACSMHLVLKFFDVNKIPVSRAEFRITKNSIGWNDSLESSRFSTRTVKVVVPARAVWMDIWIDSGGHDETTGVWLVDDLKIWERGPDPGKRRYLFEETFEQGRDLDQPQGDLTKWVRDGGSLDGARVWKGAPAEGHALLIVDEHPGDYAAWRLKNPSLVPVIPGQELGLEWREVFSVGRGRAGGVTYTGLPSGHYQLRIREVSAMGVPTGEEAVLPVIIAPPFYANVWFKAALFVSLLATGLGMERVVARKRMRRKLELLERKQALQQERARIARDIHDDLGTVLSRISMLSESAAIESETGSRQQQRLGEICQASRQLAQTMEEIVWAQDPKHDSIDNTVSYFCSFASDLLAVAQIACRLDIPLDLPAIPLEAEKRHELFLVFKESLNNIIKHSGATEVRISLKLEEEAIRLAVEDNGHGFRIENAPASKGNGLPNMRNRLTRVGGRVDISSAPGKGTRIEIYLPLGGRVSVKE